MGSQWGESLSSGDTKQRRVLATVLLKRSGEREAAARRGDGTAEFLGRFDPFLDDDFDVGESFLIRFPIGGAAGQLWNLCDKTIVGLPPIDDDLVSKHRLLPPSDNWL